jgi:hypothetical protein
MNTSDPVWAHTLPTKVIPGSKKETWVQVKIPNLRANGLPSKRAILIISRAPKQRRIASEWVWQDSTVRVITTPFDPCTQFIDAQNQFFLAAYIPTKFTRGQVVWGDRLWFQFNTDALSEWLPKNVSIKDPDVWFHDFLTNPVTLLE